MGISDISIIFLNPIAILLKMSIKELAESLHPLERKVLPLIEKSRDVENLVSFSKLEKVEVLRALQWLENKKLVESNTTAVQMVSLDKNGLEYVKKGLPEKRF